MQPLPDLCWVRKPNTKVGIGGFAEQYLGHDIGVFGRGMYADGKTEVYAYTSDDRSATLGLLAKGTAWSRSRDVVGIGRTPVIYRLFMQSTWGWAV